MANHLSSESSCSWSSDEEDAEQGPQAIRNWLQSSLMLSELQHDAAPKGHNHQKFQVFSRCSFLTQFPLHMFRELYEALEYLDFDDGQDIICEGDPGDSFYILLEGRARVHNAQHDELALVGSGDFFGELSLLYGGTRRATVTTLEPTRCARLHRSHLEAHPDVRQFLVLQNVSMLKGLPQADQVALVSKLQFREYSCGEKVVVEGDEVDPQKDGVYIIDRGQAEVIDSAHGRLTRLHEGHIFGDMALVTHKPRVATVLASSPKLLCLVLTKADFDSVVSRSFNQRVQKRVERVEEMRDQRSRNSISGKRAKLSKEQSAERFVVSLAPTLQRWKDDQGNQMFNTYKVVAEVGKGSFGTVYRAVKLGEEGGSAYAVKVMKRSLFRPKKHSLSRYAQNVQDAVELPEIATMKKLRHKNIVRLHEVIDDPDEDLIVMVMEFVGARDAMQIVQSEGPMDDERARVVFRHMLRAVAYMHDREIVHCDIKPANVLVEEGDEAKLCDFGVARKAMSNDKSAGPRGTPAFMAPELLTEMQPVFSPAVDVWGLGATLFMLVTGSPPFVADNREELEARVCHSDLAFPLAPQLDPHLKHLIQSMLQRVADNRISVADLMQHEWVTREGTDPMYVEDGQ